MLPRLERAGPTPIYQQIQEWLWQQITHGIWPEHYKLKSEADLAGELGVSRGTVRKAIAELITEGMLVRIHGRGTFVASRTLEQPLAERLVAFSEDLIDKGVPFETHVLEQVILRPSDRIASMLSVPSGGAVFFLKRVRTVGQVPLILLHNYVVHERCAGIEQVDFTQYRLFQALEELFGLELDWGRRTFQAQTADKETVRLLKISESDPVMYMEQVVYLSNGSPIELSDLWLRGDRYRLSATVKRDGPKGTASSSNKYL